MPEPLAKAPAHAAHETQRCPPRSGQGGPRSCTCTWKEKSVNQGAYLAADRHCQGLQKAKRAIEAKQRLTRCIIEGTRLKVPLCLEQLNARPNRT